MTETLSVRVLRVLKSVEWAQHEYPTNYCPICFNDEDEQHGTGCLLKQCIGELTAKVVADEYLADFEDGKNATHTR